MNSIPAVFFNEDGFGIKWLMKDMPLKMKPDQIDLTKLK